MSKTTISIPADLAVEFRQIAKARNLTVTDLVRDLVKRENAALGIGLSFPELDIAFDEDEHGCNIIADFYGEEHREQFTPTGARSMGEALIRIANLAGGYMNADSPHMLSISRRGGAVVIETKLDKEWRRTMAPSIAKRMGKELIEAAADAEALAAR